ncbi:hypothetical protein PsYK624_056530 [Phanerochaete sordida]|uniref:Protein kinase domain-containing protein n=1 Tax=Phanerochaete sordida TaxID=48140 RepID=A0A9P3G8T0_9APHY|nr:hypothetical protein PsYK624_056530 [Phanerochaete sordida]
MAYLKQGPDPALRKTNNGYVWKAFPTAPKYSEAPEDVIFQKLEDVVEAVATAANHHLMQLELECTAVRRFRYTSNHNRTPLSSHRNSESRPDAYFLTTVPSTPRPRWWDIGPVAEFKKTDTLKDRVDNFNKILWDLSIVMREDPCRRAAWGFTIENTTVHLWYCDRSQIISSTGFDLFEDQKLFVQFLLSIIFTDPSGLGWDPTIRRIETPVDPAEGRECQYEITVHNTVAGQPIRYRTLDILFHAAADGILGRGTRVWSAYRVGTQASPSNTVAVKDCWVESDGMREGHIMHKIREAVEKDEDPDSLQVLEDHLPHILAHGDVLVDDTLDATPRCLSPSDATATSEYLDLARSAEVSVSRDDGSNLPSSHDSLSSYVDRFPRNNLRRDPMVHYRLVTQEVGHALRDEKSLRCAFRAIGDITKALVLLHTYGWVHRDISPGNILVYKGRGLLTDFEYAECWKENDQAGHAMRPGTRCFMSVEVDIGDYAFRVRPFEPTKEKQYMKMKASDVWRRFHSSEQPSSEGTFEYTIPPVPFRYHPLNDWESLFWVSAYMLINRLVDPGLNTGRLSHPAVKISLQRDLASSLFYNSTERRKVIAPTVSGKAFLDKLMACLHQDLLPVGRLLDTIRMKLNMAYLVVEADLSSRPNGYASLLLMADEVAPLYRKICDYLEQESTRDIVITRIPPAEQVSEGHN